MREMPKGMACMPQKSEGVFRIDFFWSGFSVWREVLWARIRHDMTVTVWHYVGCRRNCMENEKFRKACEHGRNGGKCV